MSRWQLPNGWVWKKISEISDVNPRRPTIPRNDDEPTSFVPMENVDEVEGKFKRVQVRPYGEVKRGYTYFEEGDVLFAKITPSMENGKTAIARNLIDGFGFGTTEFHVFRPHEQISPDWIHYFIRRTAFRSEAKQHFRGAVGQQRVPADFLETHEIPVPYADDPPRSLDTQHRILARIEALLGEVRDMRALQSDIGANTNRLMNTVLADVFSASETASWPHIEPLGNLAEITAPLVDPTLPKYSSLPHIYGTTIEEGTGRLLDYNTAAEDGMTSSKYHFQSGAVLYSKIRPYLRKATIVDFEGVCSADMYPLQVRNGKLIPEFLLWSLLSPRFTDYANNLSGRARMPKLNRSQLFDYPMPYPSREAQKRIAGKLSVVRDEISELRNSNQDDFERIDQLEQAILAQAFRGEL